VNQLTELKLNRKIKTVQRLEFWNIFSPRK